MRHASIRAAKARYPFQGEVVEQGSLIPLAASMLLATVTIAGLSSRVMSNRTGDLDAIVLAILMLWSSGIACQFISLRRVGEWLKANAILFLLSVTAAAASAILAKTNAPYADPQLAALDRSIFGIDWPSTIIAIDGHAWAMKPLSHVYASLNWQPGFLLSYYFLTNRGFRAWRFLSAFAIAVALCVAIFPFVPAVGGYVHFAIPHHGVPNVQVASAWKAPEVLAGLRDGRLDDLSSGTLQGLITMPSFHAAAAIILAWGFWPSRLLRLPFLALNILMVLSAVPIGGHYIVDVVVGSATAWLAIRLTDRGAVLRPFDPSAASHWQGPAAQAG